MTIRSTNLGDGDIFATQIIHGIVIETTVQHWPHGVTVEIAKRSDGLTIETTRAADGSVARSNEYRHAPAV